MSGFPFFTSLVVTMLLVTVFSLILNKGLHGEDEFVDEGSTKSRKPSGRWSSWPGFH